MAQYWICKFGAYHDPGERCDCEELLLQEQKEREEQFNCDSKTGQIHMVWGSRRSNREKVV